VGGAAGQIQLFRQFGQRQRAFDQGVDDVQTAQQGLAAGRLGPRLFFTCDLHGLD
jgi:hypothetical protein